MGILKRILCIFILMLFGSKAFCSQAWINNLQSLFIANKTSIYSINIRTFNAKDLNNDGIIDESIGEERGNFLNAIDRLDELKNAGINTVLLMPVTPVGKIKALGTAGSLYSPSSFNEINPQLKSSNPNTTAEAEMKRFVDECHQRNLRVIVDLPSCGSYDLFLQNALLFKKDKEQNPIIPSDWTDVRLFDAGNDEQLNMDLYNVYAEFVDMMFNLNVDGIRANDASTKPYTFWKKLITEARSRDTEFLFITNDTYNDEKRIQNSPIFTSTEKLLDAGFDGYYGEYNKINNWQTSKDLYNNVKSDLAISAKYSGTKKVLGNFATHDQISPILTSGAQLSRMIAWLSATLPINSYSIDGFSTGDNYIYYWANKKAAKTYTDDDYYFVHRGQLDLFNFSRKPQGNNYTLYQDFMISNRFKFMAADILTNSNFIILRTSNSKVFAYARSYGGKSIIVIGNLDFKLPQKCTTFVPKISKDLDSISIKISSIPLISKGKIQSKLVPGEIQVLMFNKLYLK